MKASYKPSENESKSRILPFNSEIPKKSKSYNVVIGLGDEE
jgi:hypothetical protein